MFFLAVICTSCFLQVDKTPIHTPRINRQYYLNSIRSLEEAIRDQPDHVPYMVLQLSYYERLGWPSSAGKAIERAASYLFNDQKYFNQKITYYQSNQMFERLADELKKYPIEGRLPLDLQLTFTNALIKMGDSITAVSQLQDLLDFYPDSTFDFVLSGYLQLGDTLQTIELLYQKRDTLSSRLLEFYSQLSMWDSIRSLYRNDSLLFTSMQNRRLLAQSFREIDSIRIVEQLVKTDTTKQGRMLLLEAYEKQYKLVSATRVLDQLLTSEPENTVLLKRRSGLSDRRGYYEAALYYANQVLNLDSTDQEAITLVDQITQKIAYLRQQQQEQQIMPMLGLDSLKKGM